MYILPHLPSLVNTNGYYINKYFTIFENELPILYDSNRETTQKDGELMQEQKGLGQRIRELRNMQGLSQEELALRAGLHPAHLGHIERELKSPTIDTLLKIASALQVELAALFTWDEKPAENAGNQKLLAAISDLTERQQEDVLKMIRLMKHFSD